MCDRRFVLNACAHAIAIFFKKRIIPEKLYLRYLKFAEMVR